VDAAEPTSKLELWLLRHGATAWALNGRHTGRTDLPLLPEGEAEARALAPVLARQRFAAVLVSPLQRARRTAELAGLGAQARKVPKSELPNWVLRLASNFDPVVKSVAFELGKERSVSCEKAKRVLGWQPRPYADSILDCGRSLLSQGLIKGV
jgi:hypothetical protein